MRILVERYKSTSDATLSRIYVDGAFQCFGLEDEKRGVKVAGETRIPAGLYAVTLRVVGGTHEKYKRKFPGAHRGMLWLQNVPGFQYILIHIGNTEKDTEGCILVGQRRNEETMTLSNSTLAYAALYEKVVGAAERGELSIEIKDGD